MSESIDFGKFVTAKRLNANITIREMARHLNVSAPVLSDMEKGRCNPCDTDKLKLWAAILGLSAEDKVKMFDLAEKSRDPGKPSFVTHIVDTSMKHAVTSTSEQEWKQLVTDLQNRKSRK